MANTQTSEVVYEPQASPESEWTGFLIRQLDIS